MMRKGARSAEAFTNFESNPARRTARRIIVASPCNDTYSSKGFNASLAPPLNIAPQFRMTTITPQEFRAAFARSGLVTFQSRDVAPLKLPEAEAAWLVDVGLPSDAAPFLSFGGRNEKTLPTVAAYGPSPGDALSHYHVVGSNGEGDPIVIDNTGIGAVALLVHEDEFKAVSINSSVRQLATCLAAYARLVTAARAANGEEAFLNNDIPGPLVDEFNKTLRETDHNAALSGSMWMQEIDRLRGGPYSG